MYEENTQNDENFTEEYLKEKREETTKLWLEHINHLIPK